MVMMMIAPNSRANSHANPPTLMSRIFNIYQLFSSEFLGLLSVTKYHNLINLSMLYSYVHFLPSSGVDRDDDDDCPQLSCT